MDPIDANSDSQKRRPIRTIKWKGKTTEVFSDRIVLHLKEPTDSPWESFHRTASLELAENVKNYLPDAELIEPLNESQRAIYGVAGDHDIGELAEELKKRHPEIRAAEPELVMRFMSDPRDERFGEQWGLKRTKIDKAWQLTKGSRDNVLIGIVDSGIPLTSDGQLYHPDLLDSQRFDLGTNFVEQTEPPRDKEGHGTSIIGVVAASCDNLKPGSPSEGEGICGINWESRIHVCRVKDRVSSDTIVEKAVKEIIRSAEHRRQKAVINLSLGFNSDSETLRRMCQDTTSSGMMICAAVGNNQAVSPGHHADSFHGVISVGAMKELDGILSGYDGSMPTVIAPGQRILSTSLQNANGEWYTPRWETSIATPFVTGMVSLLWSKYPLLTNEQIKQCIIATTRHSQQNNNQPNRRLRRGYGLIDVEKAIEFAGTL